MLHFLGELSMQISVVAELARGQKIVPKRPPVGRGNAALHPGLSVGRVPRQCPHGGIKACRLIRDRRDAASNATTGSSLRREDFLNTDLVNEMLTTQVGQMGSLLVIRQICTDTVEHHNDESAIIHI